MDIFSCPECSGVLYPHNLTCHCGTEVGFDFEGHRFLAGGIWCANRAVIACNWTAAKAGGLCRACTMTRVVPDTKSPGSLDDWAEAERAKRLVIIALGKWGWMRNDSTSPEFHLLSESVNGRGRGVMMGHEDGVITINIKEADAAERARRREELGEPLRTMIGHFRHEIGHFVFEKLVADAKFAQNFRAMFGDERADYGVALQAYYANGAPADWQTRFISEYAAAHPHEDWAETFAHLLHLVDFVDSARATGVSLDGQPVAQKDPYQADDIDGLILKAGALTLALNHVNRSIGVSDVYPFVLNESARAKLAFAHSWCRQAPG